METTTTTKQQDAPWMKSLSTCVNKTKEDGYTEDFQVTKEGLTNNRGEKFYTPEQVKIVNFYRFEGASDPGDSSILYVIETDDGHKGTLVDAYGAYSDSSVSKFIVDVEEIHKLDPPKVNA